MKILITEDDAVSLKLLASTLNRLGHEVISTSNGLEGWDHFKIDQPDVIVSDWMMPEIDGLQFCSNVRNAKIKDYTYFILLTAKTGKENYHQAMQVGVDDFLPKPFDIDELAIRLNVANRIINFLKEIRTLKALLPICMYCKKIRNDGDYWEEIETYLHAQANTDFSHGICPDCFQKMNHLL